MGFFSDLFGRKKEMVSTSAEFAFSLNKTYKLEELKPFLVTPTGYAQHIVGCDVAASPKEGMEEVVCDPRVAASLPDGRKEPLLSFLFSSKGKKIDIYETMLIDKEFSLKKIKFYWYGYFANDRGGIVKIPDGFSIKQNSKLIDQKHNRFIDGYHFLNNK